MCAALYMRTRHYQSLQKLLFHAILLLQMLLAGPTLAHEVVPVSITRATLFADTGQRSVTLPHILQQTDFSYSGSSVRYRLIVDLPFLPPVYEPLGIYVSKMSLAGRLTLNGEYIGACELGPLQAARCLHQPYLFVPAPSSWRVGTNVLDIEVHATARQMNGLSQVVIHDARSLSRGPYWWKRWIHVSVVTGLAWVALSLGLISLSVSAALRGDRLYTWFGVTSIAIALGNLNYIVTVPFVSPQAFSWFVFSIHHITAPLLMLTVLSFFRQDWVWVRRGLAVFMLVAPTVIWASGNDRAVVALLYVPAMVLGPAIACKGLQWARASQRISSYFMALSFGMVVAASFIDWFRLTGITSFEGVYLVTFVIPSTVIVMGATLSSQLAYSLGAAREMTLALDRRVAERTEDLMQANRQLEELSATDGLTGLANRRHFDTTLEREWLRARRHGLPLALLMLDVDHFKKFNDTYGHLCGDECLRHLANAMKARMLRGSDTSARYGGEEFAIITSADAQRAGAIAELLRRDVENIVLPFGPRTPGMVTISIGVAALHPAADSNPRDLIQMADAALYEAKQRGRNRVVVAEERPRG